MNKYFLGVRLKVGFEVTISANTFILVSVYISIFVYV